MRNQDTGPKPHTDKPDPPDPPNLIPESNESTKPLIETTTTTVYQWFATSIPDLLNITEQIEGINEEVQANDHWVVKQELFVKVPGGGDWSGCTLHLDEAPLHIKVTVTKVSVHAD
jgi:predicted choloylglycine hydrolase